MKKTVGILLTFCALSAYGNPAPLSSQPAESVRRSIVFADKDDFSTANKTTEKTPQPKPPTGGRKSMWKAAALSLAIPGAGEYYLGHKKKAKTFFAVEATAWTGFAAFKIYSHWKKDDLIHYAHEHAGANLDDRNDEFLDLVGFYTSIREYNTLGRVFDPERPYLDESSTNYWDWQSEADRAVYRNLKNRSREANRRSQFMIGLAVVNRIVSVIDAVRDARRQERTIDDTFSSADKSRVKLAFDPMSERRQMKLTIMTNW
jgi:hypothetical protein